VHLFFSPAFFWAWKLYTQRPRNRGPLWAVMTTYGMAWAFLVACYGYQLGMLAAKTAKDYSLVVLVAIPPCAIASYYLHGRLFPRMNRER